MDMYLIHMYLNIATQVVVGLWFDGSIFAYHSDAECGKEFDQQELGNKWINNSHSVALVIWYFIAM